MTIEEDWLITCQWNFLSLFISVSTVRQPAGLLPIIQPYDILGILCVTVNVVSVTIAESPRFKSESKYVIEFRITWG